MADENEVFEDEEDGRLVSVFQDPEHYTIKHPLEHTWVLWFDNPNLGRKQQKDWEEALEEIYKIKFVEDFWAVYNNIMKPNQLTSGSNYHLFKEGIKPMWEDRQNKSGGKWLIQVPKSKRDEVNRLWEDTMLMMMGEQFGDDNEDITGAVISNRTKLDKVALWTRDVNNPDACVRIGGKWKAGLGYQASLGYQGHEDAMKRGSSFTNQNRYTV